MTPCVCFRCDAFFLFAVRKHVSVDKKIKTELVSSDGMKAALQLLIPVVNLVLTSRSLLLAEGLQTHCPMVDLQNCPKHSKTEDTPGFFSGSLGIILI